MKKLIVQMPLMLALGLILTFSSCKKANDATVADDTVNGKDQVTMTNAMNATMDDASLAADQTQNLSRSANGGNAWQNICGSTVVDTGTNHTITITYDGTTECNGVTRSGTVTIALSGAAKWREAGATLTVTINNVVVTDEITGATYTIAGTHTITNENGGLVWDVLNGNSNGPVARRHQGNTQITFADNSTRTWTFDRTRTWSSVNGLVNVALSSEATDGIDVSGTNRYGETFTDKITTPIQADNQHCDNLIRWRPYAGATLHSIKNRTVSILYGTDANGTSVGTSTYCPALSDSYGYYITYSNTKTNVTLHKFVSYWR